MSEGSSSCLARASAAETLTTRQSVSQRSGPPTPESTRIGPACSCRITKPCTGQIPPSGDVRLARWSRRIFGGIQLERREGADAENQEERGQPDQAGTEDDGARQVDGARRVGEKRHQAGSYGEHRVDQRPAFGGA